MQLEDNNGTKARIDSSHQALRASLRPHDFRLPDGTHIGGDFSAAFVTGLTTVLAAGAALFSARWTNADRVALIQRIRYYAVLSTAFGAAQENSIDLVRVNAMSQADTGGTAIELTEACRKDRRNMSPSLMQMRIASATAVGAGAGSAEEPHPMRADNVALANTAPAFTKGILYDFVAGHESPLILTNLEGFRIRNRVVQGAAGVITYTFEIDWLELPTGLLAI